MRAPMLRLFIAVVLLLLPAYSTSLGQGHNSHDSLFSDYNHDEHEHLAANAAVGKSVVVTHIVGCRSRFRLPIDMGEV